MNAAAELSHRFDDILDRLLKTTAATRTTFRLDDPTLGFRVDDVAGEARLGHAKSLRGQTAMKQRELSTVQWMELNRKPLIQSDLATSAIAAPPALIAIYGVQAQMLGPVIRRGAMQGWVSVHFCDGPRDWSDTDKAALDHAVREVADALDAAEAA